MAVAAAAADYSLLHGEILMQIIVKLPCIKSLLRCMSVCKYWYSIIKDPHFISKHRSYQKNTSRYLFAEYAIYDNDEIRVTGERSPCSIHYDNEEFKEYCRLEFPGRLISGRLTHGYSNGLICYSRISYGSTNTKITMYLWNPAIRKLKILPKFIQNPKDVRRSAFGFGFDPEFNDYKVLKIAYTNEASVLELYSLNTNSWKLISDCGRGSISVSSNHEISFVNRTFYWMSYQEDGDRMLVSLDTKNGTILERILLRSFSLRTLGDELLVVFSLSYVSEWQRFYCSDIQVYDQYWNNVLKIDGFEELDMSIDDEYSIPIGFRNNGEALFRKNFRDFYLSTFISYNMETRKAKDFGVSYRWPYFVEPFVETLVLLDDGDAKGLSAGGHKRARKTKSKPK